MLESRKPEAFGDLIEISRPTQIVEIGSWLGASALGFLEIANRLGLSPKILCIDTWLGSYEHWNKKLQGNWSIESLEIEGGEPRYFETFK